MNRQKSQPDFRTSLLGLPYDQTVPEQAPIPIATAFSQPAPEQLENYRSPPIKYLTPTRHLRGETELRRDSGLAGSSVRNSDTTITTVDHSAASLKSARSLPQMRGRDSPATRTPQGSKLLSIHSSTTSSPLEPSFSGLTLDLPSGGLIDDLELENMQFSKRGSVLLRKKLASPNKDDNTQPSARRRPPPREISVDEEALSRKVRSYYESGTDRVPSGPTSPARIPSSRSRPIANLSPPSERTSTSDARSERSIREDGARDGEGYLGGRDEGELAGGIEDWSDVTGGEVDRYGFIMPRSASEKVAEDRPKRSSSAREPPGIQRVSTSLKLAADTPRRKHTIRKTASDANATPKPQTPRRPMSSQSSYKNRTPSSHSRIRLAANKLPHNRDRRCMDEAADMLTLPPGPATERGRAETRDLLLQRKEIERDEKWRKMATVVSDSRDGGGTQFEFDTHNPKLIERTWKGIPDRWRATAWHAFLSASAKKDPKSLSDAELVQIFQDHQSESSPDDVQIDIDVPRTIGSHIMFRRRYRGGQRLLFRVLHAMSLHFPGTGYVQGMAALAATLLAYYDEEKAFVMLVRLWELRGLDKLYESGFQGLMDALEDFQKRWLEEGEISAKLVSIPTLDYDDYETDRADGTWNPPNLVRHALVPHVIQLLNPLCSPATRVGCVHAPRRLRPAAWTSGVRNNFGRPPRDISGTDRRNARNSVGVRL